MTVYNEGERLAILELKTDSLHKRMDEQKQELKEAAAEVKSTLAERDAKQDAVNSEVLKKLDAIETDLTRYRGTWGGIMLVLTALVTVVTLLWKPVSQFLGKSP